MSIINHFLKTINTESEDTKLFPNEFMYKKTTMDNYRFFTDYARRDIIYATCDNIKQRNDVSEWVPGPAHQPWPPKRSVAPCG